MMKRFFSLALTVVIGNILFAQNVDQGRKLHYYERYKGARETFEKALAANPNNIDAVYWLGQTLLDMPNKDSVGAKSLYQKALATNGNAPLLLAGMGQVELMEGKSNDARQRFETAINLTKGKDINVLNAVGRANVNAKPGDPNYAIEKLNLATQVKGFKDPETYMIMGDAYRKLIDGGNAVTSYTKALGLDPKMAAAKNKIGKVYLTQNNPDYFLPAFESATQLDPAYKPAYFELFYYYYFRDVNKAAGYLDKFIANTDPGPEVEYLKTDFLYASAKFKEARDKAQSLVTQFGDQVNPRMYRLIAYTSDTLGDMQVAKQAMTTFLAKHGEEPVLPADYAELANINSKIAGSEAEAFANLQTAVEMDTVVENKVKYIQKGAALAKKQGNRKEEANWLGVAYKTEKEPNQNDLYNWGYANYQAAEYKTADSIFCGLYQSKYPNEIFGYLWCARSLQAQDTTMEKGLAVDAYKKLAEMSMQIDSTKFKNQAISSNFYLVSYYNDIKKDKATAITYLDRVLAIDPTNADAIRIKEILTKANKPAQPQGKPKPKTTSATNSKPSSSTANKNK
jgi:tetratricopeptide (TPR) repeat protein